MRATPARGGGTARRRGRSATARRARPTCWGCAACGRRWRSARPARRRRRRARASRRPARRGRRAARPGGSPAPRWRRRWPATSSWISGSGSAAASSGSTSTSTISGTRSPSARAISPTTHLGDQRLQPLAGAAELDDVQPVVVGLDEAGHRAALAQRRDVARGAHGAQRGGRRAGHRARTLTILPATVLRTRVVRGRQHGADRRAGRVRRAARRRRPARAAALSRRRGGRWCCRCASSW